MDFTSSHILFLSISAPILSATNEENLPVDQEEKVLRESQKKNVQRNRKLTLLSSLG